MSAVWAVRDGSDLYGVFPKEEHAHIAAGMCGSKTVTVTRETLLTPAQAAVIAAAVAQSKAADAIRTHRCIEELPCSHDREHIAACARTEAAVTTLRAQEGG